MNKKFCFNYSEWVMIWFILYKLNIVNYNPKISIIFTLIHFSYLTISSIIQKDFLIFKKSIFYYIYFIIKISMLYLLFDTKFLLSDLIVNIIVILIYNIWVYKIFNVLYYKKLIKTLKITDDEKKYINIKKKYINKLNELNIDYKKNIDSINNKFKIKLKETNNIIDEHKLNRINKKYIDKFDILYKNNEYKIDNFNKNANYHF